MMLLAFLNAFKISFILNATHTEIRSYKHYLLFIMMAVLYTQHHIYNASQKTGQEKGISTALLLCNHNLKKVLVIMPFRILRRFRCFIGEADN